MVADFLSHLDDRLPEGDVQDYLGKIPYPGVKAILDNATTPLEERAELGIKPTADGPVSSQQESLVARPARFATTNVTDWKLEQKEDPILYQVVKHHKSSHNDFREALASLTDRKSIDAFVKSKDRFLLKNGLLYRKSVQGPIKETSSSLLCHRLIEVLLWMVAIKRLPTKARNAH